jgi:hypothetical protein
MDHVQCKRAGHAFKSVFKASDFTLPPKHHSKETETLLTKEYPYRTTPKDISEVKKIRGRRRMALSMI